MNHGDVRRQRRLPLVLASSTLLEGLRAGAGTFRMLLDLPARSDIGALAFADFSRATDLSTRAVVFYSVYGWGGVVWTALAWSAAARARAPERVRRLLALACACSVAVLRFTARAAASPQRS